MPRNKDKAMTTMVIDDPSTSGVAPKAAVVIAGQRDLRLDFFRGIAMFIILIAHIQSDWLALWIPARFGFSDATEMFVFCSGMASAIAFGRVFREQGLLIGTARVGYRMWQVYWAHIGLFFAVAATTVWLTKTGWTDVDYTKMLNLYLFFGAPLSHLPGLLTLTYVPNYFDILPMYIVVLAMMPIIIALSRIHLILVAVFVIGLWLGATTTDFNLPAEPNSSRPWFFNPFAWQLVFFTGFAFMSGWLKVPPIDRRLVWLAVAIVVLSIPFAYFKIVNAVPEIQAWRKANDVLINKTDFGILRYIHFLALAYLAYAIAGPKGARISAGPGNPILAIIWAKILPVIVTVGQQSLAVFVFSMFYAVLLTALFDVVGRSSFSTLWVNVLGAAGIAVVAYIAQWFKAKPWAKKEANS
jgi:hypothetical protein